MTTSRIDPAGIVGSAGPIYRTAGGGLSLAASDAAPGGGAGLRPAAVNHGNLTPSISAPGGVTVSKAVQTTVLSLPALRRLRFPVDGAGGPALDLAARTVLAALALLAAALVREQGADLRSRCLLVAEAPAVWELLDGSGGATTFALPSQAAREAYEGAVLAARAAGLPWMDEELVLEPSPSWSSWCAAASSSRPTPRRTRTPPPDARPLRPLPDGLGDGDRSDRPEPPGVAPASRPRLHGAGRRLLRGRAAARRARGAHVAGATAPALPVGQRAHRAEPRDRVRARQRFGAAPHPARAGDLPGRGQARAAARAGAPPEAAPGSSRSPSPATPRCT